MDLLAWHNVLFLASVVVGVLVALGAALGTFDFEPEVEADDGVMGALDLGQVPFTVLLLVSSLGFGISGLCLSTAAQAMGLQSAYVGIVLVVLTLVVMFALTRRIAAAFVRHVPASETHVDAPQDLVGASGTMFTSLFADVVRGADVHRIQCRCDGPLSPGDAVHVDDYDPTTKIYTVSPLPPAD